MTVSKRPLILAALFAAVSLFIGASAPDAALASSARIVDPNYPGPTACHGAGYSTIGDAVASFSAGQSGKITVCPGGYVENVSITGLGRIRIVGKPGATLFAAAPSPAIAATSTAQLTVQGLTLDGSGNGQYIISLVDTSGVFSKNTFQNQPGSVGIWSTVNGGNHKLNVTKNSFTNIAAPVDTWNPAGGLSVSVSRNVITGSQQGIILHNSSPGYGKTTVSKNSIQASLAGINIQEIGGVRIQRNTITGPQYGITIGGASKVKVIGNTVSSTLYGVLVGISGPIPANSNVVSGNTLMAAADGYIGVYVEATSASGNGNQIKGNKITDLANVHNTTTGVKLNGLNGMLDKTVIQGNKLTNMDTPYTHSGDTNTIIKTNKCTPASTCVTP